MSAAPVFASVSEAMDMARAALGYLAAADAASLAARTQAECLRGLERTDAISTAARARFLAAFTAGRATQGCGLQRAGVADAQDRDHPGRGGLPHRVGQAGGDAPGWWRRWPPRTCRSRTAGRSAGGPDKLPEKFREESDELLMAAAVAGLGLADLAALFAEMYERARGDLPDEDPARGFADRGVRLVTTFQGAGVLNGDLTPECAAVVGRGAGCAVRPGGRGG